MRHWTFGVSSYLVTVRTRTFFFRRVFVSDDSLCDVCSVLIGFARFPRSMPPQSLLDAANQRIVRGVRIDTFASILKQEVGFFDKHTSGELSSRLNSDCGEMAGGKNATMVRSFYSRI